MSQLDMFQELNIDTGITTSDLDTAVAIMAKAREDYEQKKSISNEADLVFKDKKSKLISMLQACNKSKYSVDGVGTVSVTEKLKVRVPRSLSDKKKLAEWLHKHLGDDGMHTYLSVNYQSLNSLYNQEFEHAKEVGTAADFKIPGVESPDSEIGLTFRR